MTTYNPAIEVLIQNVGISKLATALKGVKTIEEIEALNLFDQYDSPEREDAEDELLSVVNLFNGIYPSIDFSVVHTNGVANNAAGTDAATASTVGSGLDGDHNIVLTPVVAYWKSNTVVSRATKLKVYTNIVADDAPSDTNPGGTGIKCFVSQAYKSAADTALSGQRASINIGKTGTASTGGATNGIVSGGPTYAGNIGDNGTFYSQINIADAGLNTQVGNGGEFSDFYYIFGVLINSGVASKTYKFRFELEYE